MRTTIELSDELRTRLLAMAARRGEGFSSLVETAVVVDSDVLIDHFSRVPGLRLDPLFHTE